MKAYFSLHDLAFLLRWQAEHAKQPGKVPAVVSEAHPVRRKSGRIVMLG